MAGARTPARRASRPDRQPRSQAEGERSLAAAGLPGVVDGREALQQRPSSNSEVSLPTRDVLLETNVFEAYGFPGASEGEEPVPSGRQAARNGTADQSSRGTARMSDASYAFEVYSDAAMSQTIPSADDFDKMELSSPSGLPSIHSDIDSGSSPSHTLRDLDDVDQDWQQWLDERRRARRAQNGEAPPQAMAAIASLSSSHGDGDERMTMKFSREQPASMADMASSRSSSDEFVRLDHERLTYSNDGDDFEKRTSRMGVEVRRWRSSNSSCARREDARQDFQSSARVSSPRASSVDTGSLRYTVRSSESFEGSGEARDQASGSHAATPAGSTPGRRLDSIRARFFSAPGLLLATTARVRSVASMTGRQARVQPAPSDDNDTEAEENTLGQSERSGGGVETSMSNGGRRTAAAALAGLLGGRFRSPRRAAAQAGEGDAGMTSVTPAAPAPAPPAGAGARAVWGL